MQKRTLEPDLAIWIFVFSVRIRLLIALATIKLVTIRIVSFGIALEYVTVITSVLDFLSTASEPVVLSHVGPIAYLFVTVCPNFPGQAPCMDMLCAFAKLLAAICCASNRLI